eukprot:4892757-Amphidinium_carterae.2
MAALLQQDTDMGAWLSGFGGVRGRQLHAHAAEELQLSSKSALELGSGACTVAGLVVHRWV